MSRIRFSNGCEYIPAGELEEWEEDEIYDALASGNMQVVKVRSRPAPRRKSRSE